MTMAGVHGCKAKFWLVTLVHMLLCTMAKVMVGLLKEARFY